MYAQILYEALLTYDAPFDPEKGVVLVPNLAKDWSFSDDGQPVDPAPPRGGHVARRDAVHQCGRCGDLQPLPGPRVHGFGRVGQQV